MTSMKSSTLVASLMALGVSTVLVGGCATAPPPAPAAVPASPPEAEHRDPPSKPALPEPKFAPPHVAGGALVASLLTMAPARIVGDLDALSHRLALPMMLGRELLSFMGAFGVGGQDAQLKTIWDRLDPGSPVAIVWVLPQDQAGKGYCAALTFVDNAAAVRTFDEMGAPGGQHDGVAERRVPSGDSVWGGIKGRTLFISGSAEALLLGGGLAESARTVVPKDPLVMTVLPQALAKATGKTNDALMEQLTTTMTGMFATMKANTNKAAEQMSLAMMTSAARLLLDCSVARLILDIGPTQGFSLRAELVPVPGSDWAKRMTTRAPYAVDARLPVRNDSTSIVAMGNVSTWLAAFGAMFEATGPAGKAALRDTMKLLDSTTSMSCMFEPAQVGIATLCSSALRPGITNKAALDVATAAISSQHAWEAELDGRKAKPLKIKKSSDKVEIEKRIENSDATARALAKAIAGGDSFHYLLTVKDGRLLQAVGPKPKDTLARYGAASSLKDAPLVASALARTSGNEGMASVDVISFFLRLLKQGKGLPGAEIASMAAAMPGLAEMRAPFLFSIRGGNSLTGELAIPLGSLENAAAVIRGMLGTAPNQQPK